MMEGRATDKQPVVVAVLHVGCVESCGVERRRNGLPEKNLNGRDRFLDPVVKNKPTRKYMEVPSKSCLTIEAEKGSHGEIGMHPLKLVHNPAFLEALALVVDKNRNYVEVQGN